MDCPNIRLGYNDLTAVELNKMRKYLKHFIHSKYYRNLLRIIKSGYLSDGRVRRSRCDECNGAGGGIVGHNRLPHVLLDVGNVPKVTNSANAL